MLLFAAAIRAGEALASEGPVLTPPKILQGTAEISAGISKCYAFSARRRGAAGRTVVTATIGIDGRISRYELDPGIEPWQAKTATCVMTYLRFEPGTRDRVPVEAQVAVPIKFTLEGSAPLSMPKVASSHAEIEDIYRACYPQDQLAIVKPQFRVELSAAGKARKVTLVESSGVDSLDRAGACVLERLTFEPARQGKTPVEITATMPIVLRPPR